jgi:uncharacterized repeat protein (TIGR01451 family)
MKCHTVHPIGPTNPSKNPGMRRLLSSPARSALLVLMVIAVLAMALNFGSLAKTSTGNTQTVKTNVSSETAVYKAEEAAQTSPFLMPASPMAFFQTSSPGIETYDCTTGTSKDVFNLGDQVCARATGVPSGLVFSWKVSWVDPIGFVEQTGAANTNPSTEYRYAVPNTDTSNRGSDDGLLVTNRGTWRVNLTRANGSIRAFANFTVSDPANAVADVFVQKTTEFADSVVSPGGPIAFTVVVGNNGPDNAQNVALTDVVPAGAALASITQTAGTATNACLPADSQNCTIATLNKGERAEFSIIYTAGTNTGSQTTSASVTSDTAELNNANNSATASFDIVSGTGDAECVLECPSDKVVNANTDQAGVRGAVVTFDSADTFGSCGTVTASPASGSFFPVGTTTVSVSSGTGGGSCSFSVIVTEDPPPTISCPTNVPTTTTSCSATVDATTLGTPSTSGGSGTVTTSGQRSDGHMLSEPYPIGTTNIVWTAVDALNRTASCTQTVTVTSNDTTPPTVTAPPDITLPTGTSGGSCGLVVGESQLGQATGDDGAGCSVSISRTGVPAGNFFPVGTTNVTWKATDAAGNTATAVQHVTITENTPPIIFAPADASYACLSDVPAASPSQAGGPLRDSSGALVLDGNGNLVPGGTPYDNCGTPTVTVSQTFANPKTILRTYTATDAAGNTSSATQTITITDNTPPVLSCPSNITVYVPLNSTATSTTVNFSATASDNCGTANVSYDHAPGSVFSVGTTPVTVTATDDVGNSSSCTFNVTVLYNFTGFFAPVDNLPAFNEVKAGLGVPVKFSLSGNKGLNIFAAGSPNSVQITCDATATILPVEETVNAGQSSLSYTTTSDQYNYVWKTDNSWKNTCRQLSVTLNDGTTHTALFKFK